MRAVNFFSVHIDLEHWKEKSGSANWKTHRSKTIPVSAAHEPLSGPPCIKQLPQEVPTSKGKSQLKIPQGVEELPIILLRKVKHPKQRDITLPPPQNETLDKSPSLFPQGPSTDSLNDTSRIMTKTCTDPTPPNGSSPQQLETSSAACVATDLETTLTPSQTTQDDAPTHTSLCTLNSSVAASPSPESDTSINSLHPDEEMKDSPACKQDLPLRPPLLMRQEETPRIPVTSLPFSKEGRNISTRTVRCHFCEKPFCGRTLLDLHLKTVHSVKSITTLFAQEDDHFDKPNTGQPKRPGFRKLDSPPSSSRDTSDADYVPPPSSPDSKEEFIPSSKRAPRKKMREAETAPKPVPWPFIVVCPFCEMPFHKENELKLHLDTVHPVNGTEEKSLKEKLNRFFDKNKISNNSKNSDAPFHHQESTRSTVSHLVSGDEFQPLPMRPPQQQRNDRNDGRITLSEARCPEEDLIDAPERPTRRGQTLHVSFPFPRLIGCTEEGCHTSPKRIHAIRWYLRTPFHCCNGDQEHQAPEE